MGGFQWSLASETGKIILSSVQLKKLPKTYFLHNFFLNFFFEIFLIFFWKIDQKQNVFKKKISKCFFNSLYHPPFLGNVHYKRIAIEANHLIAFITHVSSRIHMTNEKRCMLLKDWTSATFVLCVVEYTSMHVLHRWLVLLHDGVNIL